MPIWMRTIHADAEIDQVHSVISSGSASAAVAAVEGLSAAGHTGVNEEGVGASVKDAWCVADIDAEIASIQKMHLVETTRVSYKRCQKKFYNFSRVYHPEVVLVEKNRQRKGDSEVTAAMAVQRREAQNKIVLS
jgi:hypothetical protein